MTTPSLRPAATLPARAGAARTTACAFSAALLALLSACGRDAPAPAAPGAGMPPPAVGVLTVSTGSVPLATELPGRVEAARTAQVRARVTGIVQKQLFREGSDVKAGQALFQIDPAPYRAALASAQASLAKAQASLAKAQANQAQQAALVERYRPLREARAISEQEFVNAQAAQAQAAADVAAANAAIQTAQLNVGYATVTAPIAGRIGRALVSVGALVSQAEATQMALVQQTDPVYVNSTQSVAELRRLRNALASGRATAPGSVPVRIVLDDGTELGRAGKLLFSDVSVDASSGQVSLRAEVPNPDLQLLPGMYVRVRLAQAQLTQAVLLPQQAVSRSAQGDTVMVVGPDNKPAARPVRIGGSSQGQWIVLEGLQPGERVVAEGFQKMRPGQPVTPVPWTPGASAPAAPGAPAAQTAPTAPAAPGSGPAAQAAALASVPTPAASR